MTRRAVITGLGVLAPNGVTPKEFATALWDGRGAVDRVKAFDPSGFASQMAGEVPDVELPGRPDEEPDGLPRAARFALAAAEQAMEAAGLLGATPDPRRTGVVVANAIGGTKFMTEHFPDLTAGGSGPIDVARAHRLLHEHGAFNTPAAAVADAHGIEGPVVTLTTGCTGGNDALGFALDAVRRGDADVMVAGATEAAITPFVTACFDVIGAMSVRNDDPTHASRPFDRDRDGFVIGEGVGLCLVEEREHAVRRGAPILAELAGFGSSANAFHMTDLPAEGEDLARSFSLALDDARCGPEHVGYVNAHGSSTPQNDVCETSAIKRVLGHHAPSTPVSSIKSMVGHALSAANALEAVASVLAIQEGVLPPTINYENPDPACDLDYVPNQARERQVDAIASLSSGFGGIHSTIVLRRPQGGAR